MAVSDEGVGDDDCVCGSAQCLRATLMLARAPFTLQSAASYVVDMPAANIVVRSVFSNSFACSAVMMSAMSTFSSAHARDVC